MSSPIQAVSNRAAAPAPRPQQYRREYIELKANVHKKLLNRLNLEALAQADRSRAENEIRTLVIQLVNEEGTASNLVTLKALTKPMLEFLSHCVRTRMNTLISGGTGAGKTTLLNVLSGFIGARERIVTIEDAAELQLHQEHVARLETRPPNVEGKGAIRQRQLVINALRMRPDRIVVGEVRGEEALDMLQAMNTGHDGSLTTVHANTARDALSRIETMIAMGETNLPERAMRQQISSAIQFVLQQTRLSDGSRKVTSISEITGMEGDVITMQEIFVFEKVGVTQDGKVIGRFRATGVRPKCCERLKASGIHLPADMFEGVTEVR